MAQIRYEIPDAIHRALKARAAMEGVTIRELLTRLIAAGLESQGGPR